MFDIVVRAATVFAVSVVGVAGLAVILFLGAFIAPLAGYFAGATFALMLPGTWSAFHQYAGLPAELGAGGALLGFVSLFIKSFTVN